MKNIIYYASVVILSLICVTFLGYYILNEYSLKNERDDIDKVRQKKQVMEERQEQLQNLEGTAEEFDFEVDEELVPYKESLEEINSGILLAIGDRKLFNDQQEVLKQYKELLDQADRNVLLNLKGIYGENDRDEFLNKYKTIIRDTNRNFLNEIQKSKTEEEQQSILSKYREIFRQLNNELPKSIEYVQTSDTNTEDIPGYYQELYDENTDLVGWITIDGTIIDYPVMQTIDNPDFYVKHDWNKKNSSNGLPFVDARCNKDSENIIIYAHNMKSGAMFGTLKKYQNKDYFSQHPIIEYNTLYEKGEYQIIGVVLTRVYFNNEQKPGDFVYYDNIELDTEEQFNYYIDNVKSLSLYDTGETATYGDKLITLSTCYGVIKDRRIIVVAKKIS